jgi:hypothetical protein
LGERRKEVIYVSVYIKDKQGFILHGSDHDRSFARVEEAAKFIHDFCEAFDIHEKSRDELLDVVYATATEYVGTDHDLMHANGEWGKLGISIEGKAGPGRRLPQRGELLRAANTLQKLWDGSPHEQENELFKSVARAGAFLRSIASHSAVD